MREIFKKFLFTKNILVSDKKDESADILKCTFILGNRFGFNITKGLENLNDGVVSFVASQIGSPVPKPYYINYPASVKSFSVDELLFDQLVHYTITYGFGDFSRPGHSILEGEFKRGVFRDYVEPKNFVVLTSKEALKEIKEIARAMANDTRPLDEFSYAFFSNALFLYKTGITEIKCKETAIRLYLDSLNNAYLSDLYLSDVIKILKVINNRVYNQRRELELKDKGYILYDDYIEENELTKLNIPNRYRRILSSCLDYFFETNRCDTFICFEKKKIWNGLLHHIHYIGKNDIAKDFINKMRGKKNYSRLATFEELMNKGDVIGASDYLIKYKGKGAFLRSLNYIVSRCKNDEEISFVLDNIKSENNILILSLLYSYSCYVYDKDPREFVFYANNLLINHTELESEVEKRKSLLTKEKVSVIVTKLNSILEENLKGKIKSVYIDKDMYNYAVPLSTQASSLGFGVLSTGSRIKIENGNTLRLFTYWEKVNDIDLSLIGIDDKCNKYEFSWRTMYSKQSDEIAFSGDQTSGFNGGSEYFDVNLKKFRERNPKIKYLITCDNVFSGKTFSTCFCKAGYMIRKKPNSGEVYEPKTVQTSFLIDSDSTFAYLFAIDLEKRELIWLNMSRNSNERIAGETSLKFIQKYFNLTEVMNVGKLFKLLSEREVDNYLEADVIVSDKVIEEKGKKVIRSLDFEKIKEYII